MLAKLTYHSWWDSHMAFFGLTFLLLLLLWWRWQYFCQFILVSCFHVFAVFKNWFTVEHKGQRWSRRPAGISYYFCANAVHCGKFCLHAILMQAFYYLVQDLKCFVFSLISLHFKVHNHIDTSSWNCPPNDFIDMHCTVYTNRSNRSLNLFSWASWTKNVNLDSFIKWSFSDGISGIEY